MEFLAVIPARGGSKGVPRKNLRELAGKPLIQYSIEAALGSTKLTQVVVSTDDPEIATFSRSLGVEVVERPEELAQDSSPTLPVLRHALEEAQQGGNRFDAVVTLQPTSPLRTSVQIDDAITLFEADHGADSLVSCVEVPHHFHPVSVMRMSPDGYLEDYLETEHPLRRQEKEQVYARDGASIYITRVERLDQYVVGGRLLSFLMKAEDSIDIDTEEDLQRAERRLQDLGD